MERVELLITTDDPVVAELCRLYWAVDSDGQYLHTVKDLTERFGLRPGQVNSIVSANSEAFTLDRRCPRCKSGFSVKNRTDLANSHRWPASECSKCRSEIAAIRKRETEALELAKRAAISAAFQITDKAAIAVGDLDLRLAVTLAALLRDGDSSSSGIISPLASRSQPLAPTESLGIKLTRSAFEQKLIAIHPSSAINAFGWDQDIEPSRIFFDRVAYYLSGTGPIYSRIARFDAEFEAMMAYDSWPSSWVEQLPEFWLEVAVAECTAYLVFLLERHGLEFNPGEQTQATIRKGLKWFSIGQLYNIIWRAARDAAAYKARENVPKYQAANSAVTRLRTKIEQAYAEGWRIQSFRRDARLPVSAISHILFTAALKLSDPLTFNPLLEASRSPIQLRWDKLSAEKFERLLFSLVMEAEGYADVDWLMKTHAPDHGRDIGAIRLRNDSLSGYVQERVVIQCKHWLSRSLRDDDVAKEVVSVSHWDNPPVDVLVIATSGRFTADAVTWVERHNAKGVRPRIEMWNDAKLESLLADRPHLVLAFELR